MTSRSLEIHSSEIEGDGWWILNFGIILEDSMGLFNFVFFGASGAVGGRSLHPWVF